MVRRREGGGRHRPRSVKRRLGHPGSRTRAHKMVIVASSGLADLTGKACTQTSFQWAYDTSVLAKGTASTVVKQGFKKWFFITADVAFGYSLANESKAVVLANGGTVLGEVKHPYISSDFSSYIVQAQ